MTRKKKLYIKAIAVWLFYAIAGKIIFVNAVLWSSTTIAYVTVILFSILFSVVFLYIFSHEDFFKFAKVIERMEMEKEKKWLNRFSRFHRTTSIVLIGTLLGPLFLALTVKLLIPESKFIYWLTVFVSIVHGSLWLFGFRNSVGHVL